MTALLPHDTLDEEPVLRLDGLLLDGNERPDLLEPHLDRIDLSSRRDADWNRLTVRAVLRVADDDIAALIDEGLEPRAIAVVACDATNLRIGVLCNAGELDGEWTAEIAVEAADLRGKVTIEAEVVADLPDRPARRLGTSNAWSLYVDATAVPPFEGTFRVVYTRFEGPERLSSIPESAASESFFIELDGSVPLIHLNDDMDGLRELLSGGADQPPLEIALRDAEMRRVATAAWTAAIGVSAAAITVDEETGEYELPDTPWMADVLRWSLPLILPGAPIDEALGRLRRELQGADAAVTQSMIQLTVSLHMQAGKLLRKDVRGVGG